MNRVQSMCLRSHCPPTSFHSLCSPTTHTGNLAVILTELFPKEREERASCVASSSRGPVIPQAVGPLGVGMLVCRWVVGTPSEDYSPEVQQFQQCPPEATPGRGARGMTYGIRLLQNRFSGRHLLLLVPLSFKYTWARQTGPR